MSEQHERVAAVCPSCSPDAETVHEVLKPGGQATVRCTECSHVHKTTIEREREVPLDVVVSQDGESFPATVDAPAEEQIAVGEEFIVDTEEAILTRLSDGVVAFRNSCPHWTDVRLDRGSGALVREDELVCQKHGATFERETGVCDFGPCEGAILDQIDVTAENGDVYLTDDDYEFDSRGSDGDRDLSSGFGWVDSSPRRPRGNRRSSMRPVSRPQFTLGNCPTPAWSVAETGRRPRSSRSHSVKLPAETGV